MRFFSFALLLFGALVGSGCSTVRSDLLQGTGVTVVQADGPREATTTPITGAMCVRGFVYGRGYPITLQVSPNCALNGTLRLTGRDAVTGAINVFGGQACVLPAPTGEISAVVRDGSGSAVLAGGLQSHPLQVDVLVGADTDETPSRYLSYRFTARSSGEAPDARCAALNPVKRTENRREARP
jgi:hypothetical protein